MLCFLGQAWARPGEARPLLALQCRYEEELSSALRDGELNSEAGVSDWLCLTTARHCDTTRAEEAAAAAKEAAATKGAGDAAGNSGGGGEGAGVNEAIKQQESAAPDAEL